MVKPISLSLGFIVCMFSKAKAAFHVTTSPSSLRHHALSDHPSSLPIPGIFPLCLLGDCYHDALLSLDRLGSVSEATCRSDGSASGGFACRIAKSHPPPPRESDL